MQADGTESGEDNASEEGSRNGKQECELGGLEGQNLEKDSTETVRELSKEREPDADAQVHEEHQYLRERSLGRDREHVKDEEEQFESEKEKESDEEKQSQSVKDPVDHVHIQQENATEKIVAEADKCGLDHEKAQKETKTRSVIEWAHIRPCLASIEAMMCSRVKNLKYMQNKQKTIVGDHASSIHEPLSSIEESEQYSGENDHDSETSTSRSHSIEEEHDAQGSVSPEPFFPWYEELEVLVRLGVPKDLRGEVKLILTISFILPSPCGIIFYLSCLTFALTGLASLCWCKGKTS